MEVIGRLQELGYKVEALEGRVVWEFVGQGEADADQVRPLLAELRRSKAAVLAELVNSRDSIEKDKSQLTSSSSRKASP